jgi:hypothetical protein
MREVMATSWSIARSGWRSTYNRSFRFSKLKTAAIFIVLQAVFFLFIARRAPLTDPNTAQQGYSGLLTLMAIQMGWFGLMFGFGRGQAQLYEGILVPLFQISPARPLAFIIGRVIEAVPSRAWSCLLWAYVYSGIIPGYSRWSLALLLAGFGLLVGMVAHLSGLLILAFWSNYSPKTMRNGTYAFGTVTLGMVTWAVIYLSQGGTVTHLSLIMRHYRPVAMGAVSLLGAIPGLLLLGAAVIRPIAVENLYRQGVYKVIELGESDVRRPSRSVWLPIKNNVLRAVLSREWLELARNRITRIQLMVWVAGTIGVIFAGRAMAGQPVTRVVQFVGALSFFTWFMAFGHWVVRVFEKERRTLILYRLAAISTQRFLLAKFLAIFLPSVVLVSLGTMAGSLAAGLGLNSMLQVMFWSILALVAGTFGGFGLAAATSNEEPEEQEVGSAPKRDADAASQTVGSPWWSIARTLGLIITAALPIWNGAGQPGLPWKVPLVPILLVNILLPTLVLVAGVTLMVRYWERSS